MGFPGGSVVKNPPVRVGMRVPSLGQEDALKKEISTYSRTLVGKSHGQRSLVGYSPWGSQKTVGYDLDTKQQQQSLCIYRCMSLYLCI